MTPANLPLLCQLFSHDCELCAWNTLSPLSLADSQDLADIHILLEPPTVIVFGITFLHQIPETVLTPAQGILNFNALTYVLSFMLKPIYTQQMVQGCIHSLLCVDWL